MEGQRSMERVVVIVCGDRHWTDADFVFGILDSVLEQFEAVGVIEGGCRGADRLAQQWALEQRRKGRDVSLLTVEADWKRHGRAAGPLRNRQMLQENPNFVLAFHDDLEHSRGTRDMIRQAEKAGVTVLLKNHRQDRDSPSE